MYKAKNKVSALILIALWVSGCSTSDNGQNSLEAPLATTDQMITSSVNKPNDLHGVEDQDANIIKDSVASTNPDHIQLPITWQNNETTANGQIVSIRNFEGRHGQKCKAFRTSLNNYQGTAFYDGETCQVSPQAWALTWFKPYGG